MQLNLKVSETRSSFTNFLELPFMKIYLGNRISLLSVIKSLEYWEFYASQGHTLARIL